MLQLWFDEIKEDGVPVDEKVTIRFSKLAGLVARKRVSLLLPTIEALDSVEKEWLFEEHIQKYLEFQPHMKQVACKMAFKKVGKAWRSFRSIISTNS